MRPRAAGGQVRRPPRFTSHRGPLALLGILMLMIAGMLPAAAYFTSSGAGAVGASTGTLDPPTAVTASTNGSSTVTVQWTVPLSLPAPTGYTVYRVGSGTAAACGSSTAAPITGTSCVDSSVPDGTYTYVVTSVYRSWTSDSAPSASVTVATPAALAVTGQPTATIAGEFISPAVTVALRTSGGTAAPTAGVPITLAFGANPAGGVLAGTLTVSTNAAGVASFADISITKAGAGYSLSATSPGLTAATSSTFTVTAAPSFKLVFTTAPVTGVASSAASRGPMTIQSRDAFDNPTLAPAGGTAVTLSSSSTGTKIFAATSGGTSITAITIPAGSSTASFYYGDTLAGSPVVSASRTGFSTAHQTETIIGAAPARFVFVSAPVTGSASLVPTLGPLTVQLTDTFGNTTVAAASTTATMALSSSSTSTTKVFAATLSGVATTTVSIPAGASTTTFYYGDSKAGSATLSVSRSGLTTATQATTTAAGPISQLAITSTAITGAASSTAARGPITVQSRDQYGNTSVAPAGGIPLSLASSSTGVTVFSTSVSGTPATSVTIAAAASTVSFYYGDTKAGTATITVSSAGLTSATQNATITGASPAALAFSNAPVTGAAASTAARGPFNVQLRDAFGNVALAPTGGTVITLASNSSGTKVFASTASGTAVTTRTVAAGASTASFYYGDTKAGTPTITLTATGLTSATQITTVIPAAPTVLVITSPALSGAASSSASLGPITMELRDPFGNTAVAPAAGTTVTLASTSTGSKVFSATQGGAAVTSVTVPPGGSSSAAYYGDSKTGTPTITLSGTGLTSATQIATITGSVGTNMVFTSTALSGAASGTASMGPATVQLRDSFGNAAVAPAAGVVLSLSSTSTGSTVFSASLSGPPAAAITIAGGASTAVFYYGDSKSGTPTITAAATGIAGATQTETVTAAAANQLIFTSAAIAGTASATANLGPVTVQLQDPFGNVAKAPAGGTVVSLSSSSAGTKIFAATLSGTSVAAVTIPAGSSTVNFHYGDTRAGTTTLGASGAGITSSGQAATIRAAAATKLGFPAAAVTGPASSTATIGPITVQVTDTFGNPSTAPVGGTTVTLASTTTGTKAFAAASGGTTTGTVLIPAGSTSIPFFYGDTKAGTPTITVSAAGFTSATQVETVTGATPTQVIITSAALTGQASSSASLGPLTIALRDAFANPTTAPAGGTTITLASSSAGTTVFSATPSGPAVTSVTIPVGDSGFSLFYADTKVGNPTISVTGTGLTGATQAATITAAAASKLVFGQQPTSTSRGSTIAPAVTVRILDQFDNPTTSVQSVTIAISNNPAGGTLNGTVAVAASGGVATFSTLSITAGSTGTGYTLRATATGLTAATSTAFTVT